MSNFHKELSQRRIEKLTFIGDSMEDIKQLENEIQSYPLRISAICPLCEKTFFFLEDQANFSEVNDTSTDCPHCDALLLIRDNKVWPFHLKLNQENSKWPKDGKKTSYLEI